METLALSNYSVIVSNVGIKIDANSALKTKKLPYIRLDHSSERIKGSYNQMASFNNKTGGEYLDTKIKKNANYFNVTLGFKL